MNYPYSRQCLDDDDFQAIQGVLKGDFLTTGPAIRTFEEAVAKKVGCPYAVAVANGTIALQLAVAALELPNGFRGYTSPLTFAASANAILYEKGLLGLIDIAGKHPNLCVEQFSDIQKGSKPAQLLIPVSYAGYPADLPAMQHIAAQSECPIIEDASHAFGSTYTYQGQTYYSGSCAHSDLATFSFHPVKNITCAEGGMIMTRSKSLYEKLLQLRNHGMVRDASLHGHTQEPWYYEVQSLGYNARLSDIHAALGLSQLHKLDEFKSKRSHLFNRYNQAFSDCSWLQTPSFESSLNCNPFYHLYPLRLQGEKAEDKRRELYQFLRERDIFTQVHYIPIHFHKHFQNHLDLSQCNLKTSEDFYQRELSLPLYPTLSEASQDHIIQTIKTFES